jgi:thiamine-phosphate pyrophosphorylase
MRPMLPSRLYAIIDDQAALRAGWTVPDCAAAWLDAGARLLQVRAKAATGRDFLAWVDAIARRLETCPGAQVFINDRIDVALAAGLSAVHVGQDDLPVSEARALLGATGRIGLSTHTPAQVAEALTLPIDYLAVGPVFGTATKDTGYEAVGLDLVRAAAAEVQRAGLSLPVVAIGGVTIDRALEVIEAGAAAVAVIGALYDGPTPAAQVRRFLRALGEPVSSQA